MNLNNLDLNLLKALHALLEEKNVTRAAARLSLTQPAVSGMLSRLRRYFDDPILVRTAGGMQPTNRALELAQPLKHILGELETLVQPSQFDPQHLEYTLKIGTTDNGMRAVGIPLIRRLAKLAPKVKTAFFALENRNLAEMLEKGELDLVLMSSLAAPPQLHYKPLYEERYICVMRRQHPVLAQPWNLDTFCRQRFILGSFYGGGFFGATDKALEQMGLQREVAVSVQSFALIPDILRQSDHIAIVPAHLVQPHDDLVSKEPPLPTEGYTKIMAWHERSHFDKVQQWFRGQIGEIAGEIGTGNRSSENMDLKPAFRRPFKQPTTDQTCNRFSDDLIPSLASGSVFARSGVCIRG